MERCDFASVMAIIKKYISENNDMGQLDYLYSLFDDFVSSDEGRDFDFDNGLVCRWMNGQAKVSPRITKYYTDEQHQRNLARDIYQNILPVMFDSGMAVQKIYELVIGDESISERKKMELIEPYPCRNKKEDADFIAPVLYFSMDRDFVKRDAQTKKLLACGDLSPVLAGFIMGNEVPKPCRYFCGKEQELELLHKMLSERGKLFLYGIAGIGKSEIAKAYAKQYKNEYTNIIYIVYSGDLRQDMIDLDFIDDRPDESEEERFRRHNRFLRTLKSDTLLIIDNFNVTATKDSFLSVVMKYRCRILFTTRSRMDHYATMELSEISDKTALLKLMGRYYSEAGNHESELSEIIDTVHRHTLAVELAARLLEHGILEPRTLLQKLQEEKVALDSTDRISIKKDGKPMKETYYGHIHTLFSLYLLSEKQQMLMRNMVLIPLTGIASRRLADWLSLPDLNLINDLIEMGFITPLPGRCVALHPMIQEIAQTDLKPSIVNCMLLLSKLQDICLHRGLDITYYKVMFQTIENIILLAEKDDLQSYLRFLEDAFAYMVNYHYEEGMNLVLQEMQSLLGQPDPDVGTIEDRALLLDYRASREKDQEKAVKLDEDALALLPIISTENALLVSNIHSNLGARYRKMQKYDLARHHMETGIQIMEKYQPAAMNDCIAQIANYAVFLCDTGEPDRGLYALRKLARTIKENNSDMCGDYAVVQETIGSILLLQGKILEAGEHFKKATAIYEIIWADSPELLEAKYQEIMNLYPQASIHIAQEFLSKH